MRVNLAARGVLVLVGVALLPGCATYYNHYGRFSAENASGELREHLIHWQTADYPEWWLMSDRSTSITLETQCSERPLHFVDIAQEEEAAACGSADYSILWCGQPSQDLTQDGLPIKGNNHLCGWISGPDGKSISIPEIASTLQISMQCWPANPTVGTGEDKKNFDYLKSSSVPYVVSVKKVEQGSWEDRPMKLDLKLCKVEDE